MANIRKNEVVFWGGDHDSYGHYDEMWLFNLVDSSWQNIQTTIKPDGRYAHGIVNFGENRIFLFGGADGKEGILYNDSWLFTLQPNEYIEEYYSSSGNFNSYIISDNENKLKIKSYNVGKLDNQLYDIFGKKLLEKEDVIVDGDNTIINIDVSGLSNGLYFLLTHQNNYVEVAKVLISR